MEVLTNDPILLFGDDKPLDLIYDMETADPDDFFALCFLLNHPRSFLRAVTLYPGSKAQVGLVKRLLDSEGNSNYLVGSNNPNYPKNCVSPFHYKIYPDLVEKQPDGIAKDIIKDTLLKYPNAIVITGGPPFNLAAALKENPELKLRAWVGQGGFAGDSIVDEQDRLEKFKGKEFCQAANWGSVDMVNFLLTTNQIQTRLVVSKNVCHGVVYDAKFHDFVKAIPNKTSPLVLVERSMELYLDKKSSGKKFHDPLACAALLDPSIIKWKEVTLYHNSRKEWASKEQKGTNTFISIGVNLEAFRDTFCRMK